ncbi:hypothetical protein TNCV_3721831 [Trichonephila clavipes]|nr:hypothetical protein TNCV_3721831 [Trichonephila clavipes]
MVLPRQSQTCSLDLRSGHFFARAVGSLVVRASNSRPGGLGSMPDATIYPPSTLGFPCRNCGYRGGDAIYRPFGEFGRAKRTVTCMVPKANDRRTSSPMTRRISYTALPSVFHIVYQRPYQPLSQPHPLLHQYTFDFINVFRTSLRVEIEHPRTSCMYLKGLSLEASQATPIVEYFSFGCIRSPSAPCMGIRHRS